jgi:hypothetical protein
MTDAVLTTSHEDKPLRPYVAPIRLLVGLLQGLVLYGFYRASTDHVWPATAPILYVALLVAAIVGPALLMLGIGNLPHRVTALWVVAASAIVAGLGAYDRWDTGTEYVGGRAGQALYPSPSLCVAMLAGFFIAHALILAGSGERRRMASYRGYFEAAWKLGMQLGFSFLFINATGLVLLLGAEMFKLVKLNLFKDILAEPWFNIPMTALMFTAAIHLTDVRPGIVRGIRSLLLTMLAWILPVLTLIIAGFLAALMFTGLAPLWATRFASPLLLVAAALLVILINAAWQNGAALPGTALPIRVACRLACLLVLPLCLLACYALYVRVADYGWTHDRIMAGACQIVALCYGAGYFIATLRGNGVANIAPVNIGTAFVVVAVLLSLSSPVANPQRLAVASQLARLDAGKVSAEKFDYAYLHAKGGRYGRDALAALEARNGPAAEVIRSRAAPARRGPLYPQAPPSAATTGMTIAANIDNLPAPPLPVAATEAAIAADIIVWPIGATLPSSFTSKNIQESDTSPYLPACLKGRTKCDAFLLDLVGNADPEIVLVGQVKSENAQVMGQNAAGAWIVVGTLPRGVAGCADLRAFILAGAVGAVAAPGKAVAFGDTVMAVEYVDRARSRFARSLRSLRPDRSPLHGGMTCHGQRNRIADLDK